MSCTDTDAGSMKQPCWSVWVWNSNGRRVRPKDVASNDTVSGNLLFATRLPASVARTGRDLLRGLLAARDRTQGSYTGDPWQNAVDGWDIPPYRRSLWPGDAIVVVGPTGRGRIYRLRASDTIEPSAWSCRRVPRRSLPDHALLPEGFVGGLLYGRLLNGEFVLAAS